MLQSSVILQGFKTYLTHFLALSKKKTKQKSMGTHEIGLLS